MLRILRSVSLKLGLINSIAFINIFFSGSQKMQARLSPHLWTRESVLKDRKTIQARGFFY